MTSEQVVLGREGREVDLSGTQTFFQEMFQFSQHWGNFLASQKCWAFSGILVTLKSCDLISYMQKLFFYRWDITQEQFKS